MLEVLMLAVKRLRLASSDGELRCCICWSLSRSDHRPGVFRASGRSLLVYQGPVIVCLRLPERENLHHGVVLSGNRHVCQNQFLVPAVGSIDPNKLSNDVLDVIASLASWRALGALHLRGFPNIPITPTVTVTVVSSCLSTTTHYH